MAPHNAADNALPEPEQPAGQPSSVRITAPRPVVRRQPQPRRSLADRLAHDPRLPTWIRRAVIAGAVGIAIGIWLSWQLGITLAALVAVGDTVYQSRTMSVIPAAARVAAAQRRTRRRVAVLRTSGYVALHARRIPGSRSVIDHLVIGPAGVFAVDSEYWDRRLAVRVTAGNVLYHGPVSKKERLVHARWEAAQASRLVGGALGQPLGVRPVMVIYGPKIPWAVTSLRGVDVFAGGWVRKYFRRRAKAMGRQRLSSAQIARIHEAANKVLPPVH
ncbi:MAG: nuclease-related domain-containing protein [Streptosporangiaceae bacterium]